MAAPTAGTLQAQAREFMADLARGEDAQVRRMMVVWSDSYWATRQALDDLLAAIAADKAAGKPPARWRINQRTRYRNTLDTIKRELSRFAAAGATATTSQQRQALLAAQAHARRAMLAAVGTNLPGLEVTLSAVNPANLENLAGFMANGGTVAAHMERTVGAGAADALEQVLIRGLTLGWSQDRMVRAFTKAYAIPATRATTILRTESLRVYRETSRATYAANPKVVKSWTWISALDRRTCVACVVMHGTHHPVTETLDGHPRCRCAMIPDTVSWAELGVPGVPDTSTPILPGVDWLAGLDAKTQVALMGPAKHAAYVAGTIRLEDLVARTYDPEWGTMRTERSLVAILAGRNANYGDLVDA